jgi:hypothetical protein
VHEELFVDTSTGDDRVKINFNVTFQSLACPFISVDAMDVSGEHQSDVNHNVWKERLDKNGQKIKDSVQKQEIGATGVATVKVEKVTNENKCKSCYGAETPDLKCCNTCEDVKIAYRRKGWAMHDVDKVEQCKSESWVKTLTDHQDEGCRVYGYIEVAKVAGNFHIAPGKTVLENHAHVHDLHSLSPQKFNTSHFINHFSFGETYPGKGFPLDGHSSFDLIGGSMFQYYIKTVPTFYVSLEQDDVLTHQFSVTKHRKSIHVGLGDGLPGLFVIYEFSPIMVKLTEEKKSLAHFLTSLCAIVGGVFTVASLLDSLIYHSSRALKEKIDIGKAS